MAYPSEISTVFGPKVADVSYTYFQADAPNKFVRTVGNHYEGGTPGNTYWMGYQESADGGLTWGETVVLRSEVSWVQFPFVGIYMPELARLCIPWLRIAADGIGVDLRLHLLYLERVGSVWTEADDVTLNDNDAGWAVDSETRIIRLSSGTYVLPSTSYPIGPGGPDFYSDGSSGLYRSIDGLNWTHHVYGPSVFSARGLVEPVAVEKQNGDVLVTANTTCGYLAAQVWTNDGQTPGAPYLLPYVSPRCKHDVIRLSNGLLAIGWCANPQTGWWTNTPRKTVMVGFSGDDLATVTNLHLVDYDAQAGEDGARQYYETFLCEIGGRLQVSYMQYLSTVPPPDQIYGRDALLADLFPPLLSAVRVRSGLGWQDAGLSLQALDAALWKPAVMRGRIAAGQWE